MKQLHLVRDGDIMTFETEQLLRDAVASGYDIKPPFTVTADIVNNMVAWLADTRPGEYCLQ
jgi:hypothetical protein